MVLTWKKTPEEFVLANTFGLINKLSLTQVTLYITVPAHWEYGA